MWTKVVLLRITIEVRVEYLNVGIVNWKLGLGILTTEWLNKNRRWELEYYANIRTRRSF